MLIVDAKLTKTDRQGITDMGINSLDVHENPYMDKRVFRVKEGIINIISYSVFYNCV